MSVSNAGLKPRIAFSLQSATFTLPDMIIRFSNQQNEPIIDGVVSVMQAPGQIRDLAMITDQSGAVSLDVGEAGYYAFTVFHDGQSFHASASLCPDDAETDLMTQ